MYNYTTLSSYCGSPSMNLSKGCSNNSYGLLSTYNYNKCSNNNEKFKEGYQLIVNGPTHFNAKGNHFENQEEDYAFRVGIL